MTQRSIILREKPDLIYDWQDQPGNCPTRTGPRREPARGSGYWGSRPLPGQSLVTDRSSRSLRPHARRAPHPLGRTSQPGGGKSS